MEFRLERDPGEQEEVDHCHPHLREDGVLRCSQECFDPQVLLDPLEEELDLPALFVDQRNVHSGETELVGEKLVRHIVLLIMERHETEILRVLLLRLREHESDAFILQDARSCSRTVLPNPNDLSVLLQADHEVVSCIDNGLQKRQIEVPTIDHEDRASWVAGEIHPLHRRDVVRLAIREFHEIGNLAADGEGRVEFDRSFGSPELRPREQVEAEVDGGGIDGT
ncbi:MAG: hypothetical protein RIQ56_623 [Candidatus Parcubacteria bacterium]